MPDWTGQVTEYTESINTAFRPLIFCIMSLVASEEEAQMHVDHVAALMTHSGQCHTSVRMQRDSSYLHTRLLTKPAANKVLEMIAQISETSNLHHWLHATFKSHWNSDSKPCSSMMQSLCTKELHEDMWLK